MIRTRFYLDTRATGEGDPAPLKLAIRKRRGAAFLYLDIALTPQQWDKGKQKVVRHPHKDSLNAYLAQFQLKVNERLREMILSGEASPLSAKELKDRLTDELIGRKREITLAERWEQFAAARGSGNTRISYATSLNAIRLFDADALHRDISCINRQWLSAYDVWLHTHYAVTTRNTYMSQLMAVLRKAKADGLVNDITELHPQRIITRKRNLTCEQLASFLSAPSLSPYEERAVDFFRFSFFARAMNTTDILRMTPGDIYNGRVIYNRSKTGKPYSVKVEPELQGIIDRYCDGGRLFPAPPAKTVTASYDKVLKARAARLGLPPVTLYWARHTFASLAFELGYNMDLVSASLGHSLGGASVTSTYVNIQDKQLDDMARAIYDYALKGQNR